MQTPRGMSCSLDQPQIEFGQAPRRWPPSPHSARPPCDFPIPAPPPRRSRADACHRSP